MRPHGVFTARSCIVRNSIAEGGWLNGKQIDLTSPRGGYLCPPGPVCDCNPRRSPPAAPPNLGPDPCSVPPDLWVVGVAVERRVPLLALQYTIVGGGLAAQAAVRAKAWVAGGEGRGVGVGSFQGFFHTEAGSQNAAPARCSCC